MNIEYEYAKRRVCDQCLARDFLSLFFLMFISSKVRDEERGREEKKSNPIKITNSK